MYKIQTISLKSVLLMFRSLLFRIQYMKIKIKKPMPNQRTGRSAKELKPQTKTIQNMAERINEMKQTIAQTSPRSFGILFLLSTIPTFYYINKLLQTQYNSKQFHQLCQKTLNYFYLKNTFFLTVSAVLSGMKFIVPASKFLVPMANPTQFMMPLVFTVLGLCFPRDYPSKYMVAPALGADISTLLIEGSLTNQGVLPFWFLNAKHFINFFDVLTFAIIYRALSNQQTELKEAPYKFA